MNLYGLHHDFYEGVQIRIDLLTSACKQKGIKFICINSKTFDYTKTPKLSKGDLLYNFARGSTTLENLLLNDEVATFYLENPKLNVFRSTTDWSIVHDKMGLPSPRTIYHLTTDRLLLRNYVSYLGDFPIIIKVTGGTRGIGTIKIESWQNLISVVDYLATTGDDFIMREFIEANYGVRVIVVGNEIVQSSKFVFQDGDFRNAPILSKAEYSAFTLDQFAKNICLKVVHSINLGMAGVDLLFDAKDEPYLLEVNFPTGFQSFKDDPDFVLGKMLDYLIAKANRDGK